MSKDAQALRYAVRSSVLIKHVGQLCVILGLLLLPALGATLIAGDIGVAWRLGVVILALASFGVLAARQTATGTVQINEAMVTVALMFLIAALAMTWPLSAYGLSWADALFEAVSGFTTTGLTMLADVETCSFGLLFMRAWMQWIGGLGFVVLSLVLISHSGGTSQRLGVIETYNDDLVGGVKAYARRIAVVYAAMTVIGYGLIAVVSQRPSEALLYTLAAVSTGGYAPHNASVSGLGGLAAQTAVLLTCLAGALPLAFYYLVLRRAARYRLIRLEAWTLIGAGLVVTAALIMAMRWTSNADWSYDLRHAPLLAFSAQTTSGFSSMPIDELSPASQLVLMAAMFISGGSGSTAGGLKILRLLVLAKVLHAALVRTALVRHAVYKPRLAGQVVADHDMRDATRLLLAMVMIVGVSWWAFTLAGHAPLAALFEVVSAVGTVGLSSGVTDPALATPLKALLCANMLLGRLEVIAWLVLLHPRTWLGRRRQTS